MFSVSVTKPTLAPNILYQQHAGNREPCNRENGHELQRSARFDNLRHHFLYAARPQHDKHRSEWNTEAYGDGADVICAGNCEDGVEKQHEHDNGLRHGDVDLRRGSPAKFCSRDGTSTQGNIEQREHDLNGKYPRIIWAEAADQVSANETENK